MLSIQKVKSGLSNQFVRNVGWLGGGELFARVIRLGLVVFIARILTPHDYGLAAIILTVKEFAYVLTLRGGIVGKLIQTDEKDIKQLSETAYWFSWIFCSGLFILQCLLSFPIAWFYKEPRLILPICSIALNFLAMPTYIVRMALIERENRLKIIAIANTLQMILYSLFALLFAVMGLGLWALILPHIFVRTTIFFTISRRCHSWTPSGQFTMKRWREIFDFAKYFLGTELLNKFSSNVDYLLVGAFLSVTDLGLYYFAYNSGIGISLNIINKLMGAQFPYICAAKEKFQEFKQRYFKCLKIIALVVIPFVILQASLAPFYVPIVFGSQWVSAIPILIMICLSAIPRAFSYSASNLLIAIGRSDLNFKWTLIFTTLFSLTLLAIAKQGLIPVAATVLIFHVILLSGFCLWAIRFAFSDQQKYHFG